VNFDWPTSPEHPDWCQLPVTRQLVGDDPVARLAPIPSAWHPSLLARLHAMRDNLRDAFVGLADVTDWLLAALIARENALLLGPPGVAKSEIAVRVFELLGLRPPAVDKTGLLDFGAIEGAALAEWSKRERAEQEQQKYFHYLLSRFTQPEELFGPVEIGLLRKGILARVNFGLLTGPGVRAAFLDEIFKASSNILNTLLTLSQERRYFNWGGMVPADLIILIGASNELPGGFGSGAFGVGTSQDDFQTLHAFVDRFPLRLLVPTASGSDVPDYRDSALSRAFGKAIGRERDRFMSGSLFSDRPARMPCINDVLCLGRAMLEGLDGNGFFTTSDIGRYREAFLSGAAALQLAGTGAESGRITWTISPRKLRALFKIGLAHALVRDELSAAGVVSLGADELRVFSWIWDAPDARPDLLNRVEHMTRSFRG
jgi:MoxR-like ATPase